MSWEKAPVEVATVQESGKEAAALFWFCSIELVSSCIKSMMKENVFSL